jgi:hypothetical protein
MRRYSKLIAAGAIAVGTTASLLGTAGVANAATGGTAVWAGNGFGLAADGTTMYIKSDPNPGNDGGTGQFADWDGEGDAFDQGQDGYLLWVFNAKGAANPKISLPGFAEPQAMFKIGGTFKFASPYYTYAELMAFKPSVTYDGSAKGNLVVSHGNVEDTNIVSCENSWTVDSATGVATGQVCNDGTITDPTFTARYTFETDKSWNSTDSDGRGHRYTESVELRVVNAEPIVGNATGTVYGWNVELDREVIKVIEATHYTADSEPYLANLRLPIDEQQHHRVTIELLQDGTEIAQDGYIGGSPTDTPTAGSKFFAPLP